MYGIAGNAAVLEKGHEEQGREVEKAGEKAPDEPPRFHGLAGEEAAGQAGNDVDGVDAHVHLAFRQAEFPERQCQKHHQEAGDYISDDERPNHEPRLGFCHRDSFLMCDCRFV